MSQGWKIGIEAASRGIQARELSVHELVTSVLDRLQATESELQAWAFIDPEAALAAARSADREIGRGGYRGALHGIPIGVKDVIDTAGMPTEAGSTACVGRVPKCDAATVRHLRTAGAIVLGKTITHEFAYGQGQPPTKNPWDPARYAGGSSVGSGVAVAVGSALGCLGTDTGGSVRNPAAINGVVGLRPTTGLIDCTGMFHLSLNLDQVGPIARSVTDCGMLLAGMLDPPVWGKSQPTVEAVQRPLHDVRVGVDFGSWRACGVVSDVYRVVSAALEDLRSAGAVVVEVSCPELRLGLPIALAFSLMEASAAHRDLLQSHGDRIGTSTRVMLELGLLVTEDELDLARRGREHVRNAIRHTFEQAALTALMSPTLPWTAPLLSDLATDLTRVSDARDLSDAVLMLAPANVCGLPGLSVPCGEALGLPISMHLLGRPYDDLTLLRLAYQYEQRTPWHTRHPCV
jgi:Asp-tRNA(Asn)/Glu-tRNA(Gln) amidotransferase A subunit family amidase